MQSCARRASSVPFLLIGAERMKQTVTFSRSECVQSVLGLLIGNDDIACLMQLSSDHCTSTVCLCTRFLCFLSRCQQTPNEVLEGTRPAFSFAGVNASRTASLRCTRCTKKLGIDRYNKLYNMQCNHRSTSVQPCLSTQHSSSSVLAPPVRRGLPRD